MMGKYFFRLTLAAASMAFTCLMAQTVAPIAPKTLRVDYYHTGTAETEFFALDRIVLEPLDWPGNVQNVLDDSNLGEYFFEVTDFASGKPIYSRGFCSIFAEWATTADAKEMARTFSESLRFPMPIAAAQVTLKKRDAQNKFVQVWSFSLDPSDIFIDRSKTLPPSPLVAFQKSGESANKVDLLVLGDGYTLEERGKFEKDAARLLEKIFAIEPFKTHKNDFNVWGLCPASQKSGIARPSAKVQRRSALGFSFDALGLDRYVLSYDNRAIMDAAAHAPWEFMIVLTNNREYGGGGIFRLYAVSTADNPASPMVIVHEFAHHFAGIADEYYLSPVAYLPTAPTVEPWEPNITIDPINPKWKDLILPSTPLPTPWKKDEFEAAMSGRGPRQNTKSLLEPDKNTIGSFEGANYAKKGWYRSQVECIMFETATNESEFCAACKKAMADMIKNYL
jgi:hypothetical protein